MSVQQNHQNKDDSVATAKSAMDITFKTIAIFGLPFLLATAKSRTPGRRVVKSVPAAMGMLLHFVLIGLSVHPLSWPVMGLYLWAAILRHRIWQSNGHSMDVGQSFIPIKDDAGRMLSAMIAMVLGMTLLDEPRCEGFALSLMLGAVGSIALLLYIQAKQRAEDQDALDSLCVLRSQQERLEAQVNNP